MTGSPSNKEVSGYMITVLGLESDCGRAEIKWLICNLQVEKLSNCDLQTDFLKVLVEGAQQIDTGRQFQRYGALAHERKALEPGLVLTVLKDS